MLSPEIQTEILALYFSKKKTVRAIARELGVNRKSVDRVVNRRSVALQMSSGPRSSRLDPFKDRIVTLLKEDPETTARVVLQRIRDEGYDGGYTILREWVQAKRLGLRPQKEAFFKIDFPIAKASQIDWGEFQDVFGDGVQIHCFVMVLCYSRLIYIEFTRSEKFEEFIRCHENAIRYFEGRVSNQWWFDNLPTAVSERKGKLTRFNARFLAYVGHHHVYPHACNLGKGNEKGRVEDGVKYIRINFWPNRTFTNFEDLCRQAREWMDQTANLREHRTTKKVPRLVFDHEEKAQLLEANPSPYETDEVFSEKIRPDFHIIYETNQYSVPWTLVACVVTVRIDATEIRVYYADRFVTKHERCYVKHQSPFTKPEHEEGLREIKPQGKNAHTHWQIATLESYGPSLKQYLQCLRHSHRSLKQEISRLLALGTIYGEKVLADTVDACLKRGVIGTEQVELALKRMERSETEAESLRPAPMNLKDARLERIPSRIDLRKYDEHCMKSRETLSESCSRTNLTQDSQDISENGQIQTNSNNTATRDSDTDGL